MKRAEYEKYLRSRTWQGKRRLALEAAGNRCQLCNSDGELDVHHRTYERIGGRERPADLTVLCRACHEHFHIRRQEPKPKPPRRVRNLRKRMRHLEARINELGERGDFEQRSELVRERIQVVAQIAQAQNVRRVAKARHRTGKVKADSLRRTGHTV